jgi:mannitol 2-dehydrogenase
MAVRLCNENLSEVNSNFFRVPAYDRSNVTSGILHVGPSAFFRAHLAVYADDLLHQQQKAGQPLTWGITAVSMKSSDVRDDIAQQDFLYTLTSKGKDHLNGRVIGSIRDILVAKENPEAVLEAAADPAIKVISLTVTQKGYYYDAEKGFDFNHPDIQACLNENSESMSSIGLIVSSLMLRRDRGIAPPTILSCDNFAGNGTVLRNAVLAYAQAKAKDRPEFADLHDWIAQNVAFPNNMVDRITPSKSAEHIDFVKSMGVQDARPVEAEPMPNLPFVIENLVSVDPVTNQPVDAPDFGSVGALMGERVSPYENLKLRSLNGAHMALGCIGHLMGNKYSHEAMQDPDIRRFIVGFMAEVGQTLSETPGVDQNEYRADLLRRLDNDQICDPLTRLARNGSQKVETRFLNTLRDCVANEGYSHGHLTFSIAAWIEYMKRMDSAGKLADNDQNAIIKNLHKLVSEATTNPAALFAEKSIFSTDMAGRADIIAEVQGHLESIQANGIQGALQKFLETRGPVTGMHHAADNDDNPGAQEYGPFLPSSDPALRYN